MIDTPQVVETNAQLVALVHVTVPRAKIREVMGPGIQEVHSVLVAQGIAPTGPWLTHHLKMSPEIFDFDICVPTATKVAPAGRVVAGEIRAARVARAVYRGDYAQLGAAWGELDEWVKTHGYSPAVDLWERYLTGPESSQNPADWRTELNRPIA